jgi:hypothetical protein
MTVDDQMRAQIPVAQPLAGARARARYLARKTMWRVAPAYGRRRARKVGMATALARLETDFEHVRKRHGEQIERLEDLARELVLAVESLRREIAQGEPRDGN